MKRTFSDVRLLPLTIIRLKIFCFKVLETFVFDLTKPLHQLPDIRDFEIQLENSIRELRLKINNHQSQLNNLANQIILSRKLTSTAKNRFQKSQIEFNENRITINDLLSSRLILTQAELGLFKSVFEYLQLKLEYEMIIKYPNCLT